MIDGTIGDRIRIRREQLRLSQDELAKKLGYKSRTSINKIELGKTDIPQSRVADFARALNTSVAYLMQLDGYSRKVASNSTTRLCDCKMMIQLKPNELMRLRKKHRLSQQELAETIGLSRSSIGMYETGQRVPSTEVLQAYADFFHVSTDYLLGRSDNPTTLPEYQSPIIGAAVMRLVEAILSQPGGKELIEAQITKRENAARKACEVK